MQNVNQHSKKQSVIPTVSHHPTDKTIQVVFRLTLLEKVNPEFFISSVRLYLVHIGLQMELLERNPIIFGRGWYFELVGNDYPRD